MSAVEVDQVERNELLVSGPPFKVDEAAEWLNVCSKTLYKAIDKGEIHALRLGRCIRIPRAEIARLLAPGEIRE